MVEVLELEFIQNAFLAVLLASVACGVVGTLVVVNRIVFISGGIAHSAYGGIGLAFFLGISPLLGAMGFTVAAALLMGIITLAQKHRADTFIGVIWALGMALGVVLIDLTPGYNVDLMSYLFGSILAVPRGDLFLMAVLDLVLALFALLFYQQLLALSFDDQLAQTRGVPVRTLYLALNVLIALTVVLLIRVAGLILIIALLTIPPYIAEAWCRSLKSVMLLAGVLCAVFSLTGLWLSFQLDLTSGPSIILVAGSGFFITLALKGLWLKESDGQGDESG
jgi:zinc transport system permease protein